MKKNTCQNLTEIEPHEDFVHLEHLNFLLRTETDVKDIHNDNSRLNVIADIKNQESHNVKK